MPRHRELKLQKDGYYVCPYCNSKVEWFGYDCDNGENFSDSEKGEYQCSSCHRVWNEDLRIQKDE